MNESRQTVETDTLWLSNIRALNFRKLGHLRKYCNNENFPIYGTCMRMRMFYNLMTFNASKCKCMLLTNKKTLCFQLQLEMIILLK